MRNVLFVSLGLTAALVMAAMNVKLNQNIEIEQLPERLATIIYQPVVSIPKSTVPTPAEPKEAPSKPEPEPKKEPPKKVKVEVQPIHKKEPAKKIEVKVPDIGDYHDVPVIEVLVRDGDAVEKDAPLLVLESDKATLEVPSPAAGTVRDFKLKASDKVSQGTLICSLEVAGDAGQETRDAKRETPAKQPAEQPAPAAAGWFTQGPRSLRSAPRVHLRRWRRASPRRRARWHGRAPGRRR